MKARTHVLTNLSDFRIYFPECELFNEREILLSNPLMKITFVMLNSLDSELMTGQHSVLGEMLIR